MALLGAAGLCRRDALENVVFAGELGLDGTLRSVAGALPTAIATRRAGVARLVVASADASEAAVCDGVDVFAVGSLAEALALVHAGFDAEPARIDTKTLLGCEASRHPEMADVRGQPAARRALEIAAAGGHHVLMIGPPGGGKTMLARRLPSILPPLAIEEAIETTSIHSIAGLNRGGGLMITRPFRAPHHTTSGGGMTGGGSQPRPGEVSLAHNGVLFLDELPEFSPAVLNQLREPLEDGQLTVSRAAARLTFPASFMLVGAMNPCPCGMHGTGASPCECADIAVQRYRARVSGPLLDRIDLHVHVPRVAFHELASTAEVECSAAPRERVTAARALLGDVRRRETAGAALAFLSGEARRLLARAAERLGLSARGVGRTASVARTVAALRGASSAEREDVAEALQYRPLLGPGPTP
jgi:magnesium chelatase family protein